MATIKPIEGRTVHQIQSGQVIVDLCSVVKELVENSLDAGATNIDVRFKNQGLESIEVQDNGDGISPHNYETIALKHYTSKLSTYADLTSLQTFGFRGEALSSLCALSHFTITTCMAADAPKGTKLEFETSGKLTGTGVVAAQKGTTVTVENLFNNLPVRRRELERNIKREWNRLVGVLGQYACIQTGIKFSVSQQTAKGKKTILFSTKGNQSTRENIVNVFGAKTLTALVALDLNLDLEPTSGPNQRWSTEEDGRKKAVRIVGHISRPASGEGRQTPDRQMFFVNARPCGLPQVSKAFNEVYRSYNSSQSPFIFANIELDTHLYDVNVSPDKRTILLHDQAQMLENLKTALTELFESQDYTVPISKLPSQKQPVYKQLTISRESTVRSQTPQTPQTPQTQPESTDEDESAADDSSRRPTRDRSVDEDIPRKTPSHGLKRSAMGAVSRDSLSRNSQVVSLISDWVGRGAESRPDQRSEAAGPPVAASEGLSKDKRALVGKLKRENLLRLQTEESPDDDIEDRESSVATSTIGRHISLNEQALPRGISAAASESYEDEITQSAPQEELIPALYSPVKSSTSISNSLSSRKRPVRGTAETATITIGNHTVTTSIGTPCLKRARIKDSSAASQRASRSAVPGAPLPSFGSRLSQRFAAPGTQMNTTDDEDSESETMEENNDPEALETESSAEGDAPEEMDVQSQDGDGPHEMDTDLVSEQDETSLEESDTPAAVAEEMDNNQVDVPPSDRSPDGSVKYMDESEKKALEEAKVQEMIKSAESSAGKSIQDNDARAKALIKGGSKRKDATYYLEQTISISTSNIHEQMSVLDASLANNSSIVATQSESLDSDTAEEKLSLTISKTDFARMKIIGQFNLGFILASRSPDPKAEDQASNGDELFIIDQHASDEKYNFERLQATTIVQSQPLVKPKTLDLTAIEEEIVMENLPALETNGFIVTVDETGEAPVGQRCQLVSLPLSRGTTFSIVDLEELIALLAENPSGLVPRPAKVRKMFAMRACRSSIMVGRTLTQNQMSKVVTHLGELDKPWNCPHGRPTMRHLCGLGIWDVLGWKEGDGDDGEKAEPTNWAAYVRENRDGISDTGSP